MSSEEHNSDRYIHKLRPYLIACSCHSVFQSWTYLFKNWNKLVFTIVGLGLYIVLSGLGLKRGTALDSGQQGRAFIQKLTFSTTISMASIHSTMHRVLPHKKSPPVAHKNRHRLFSAIFDLISVTHRVEMFYYNVVLLMHPIFVSNRENRVHTCLGTYLLV